MPNEPREPGQPRRRRPPIATCRLQLTPAFTFADASEVVPYLAAIGISDLYLSPIFAAVPGSTHGYDVVDHARVNPELGGVTGLYALGDALREHDMGLILDVVPNHVGIAHGHNPWWRDVLRYGQRSPYAPYFDIDWEGQPQMASGVLVYPVLGQPFGSALEAGELRIAWDGTELVLAYYDQTFPFAPQTYREALGLPPADLRQHASPGAFEEFVNVLDALHDAVPAQAGPQLERLAQLVTAEPAIAAFIGERVEALNGTPGAPATFDALDALIRRQSYRLAYWRVSGEEMNYRRFFDVNELAAIRVENQAVFDEVHALVRDLVARDIATGVRIDHVDGLYDPGQYLADLQALLAAASGRQGEGAPPVYVEKILAPGEELEPHWATDGTTGYDFLAVATGLFVDPNMEQAFTAIYNEHLGEVEPYDEVAFGARRRVAERSFAGELNVLAMQLHRIAQYHRLHRDHTLRSLREALAALLACFPVYRTYLVDDQPGPHDRAIIGDAAREGLRRDPNVTREAMAFLVEVLLLEGDLDEDSRARRLHFRRRFQQVSGPVMAKGVEDTTFFRYNRLLALNEVGCEPSHFGLTADAAHRWFGARAAAWPRAMSATTTHDTKRSEDGRARLAVLGELPREWRRALRSWSRLNARHRVEVDGRLVPEPNTEYYLYQSLIAGWEGASDATFRQRIAEHARKAMREAKLATSWTRPNEAYEEGVRAFLAAALGRSRTAPFPSRLARFLEELAPAAAVTSLAIEALKCTAPGIPDIYQGTDWPDYSLTDPDNRRPVDWARRARTLPAGEAPPPMPRDPEAKRWLLRRLLGLRGRLPALFTSTSYRRLETAGSRAGHVFAFTRCHGGDEVAVVVPRLVARLVDIDGRTPAEAWGDTTVALPAGGPWHDELTGAALAGGPAAAASVLASWPIAVFTRSAG